MKNIVLILTLFFFSTFTYADTNNQGLTLCQQKLEDLPIQQNGRVKPLYVHARESLKYLIGKKSYNDFSAVQVFCLLSLEAMGIPSSIELKTRVEHKKSKELLGLEESENYIKLDELTNSKSELRLAMNRIKIEDGYQKDLRKLLSKSHLYDNIIGGQNWVLPTFNADKSVNWVPITSFLTQEKVMQQRSDGAAAFFELLDKTKERYVEVSGSNHLLELQFRKSRLPSVALLVTLLALMALTIFKKFPIALALSGLTILIQTAIIIIRVILSGRAPITNMYETVMFSGFGALLLAMIIGHYRKEKTFIYMGLSYNLCTLMMITFADGMLTESISPLVPVLRDNFWLSTHVTTIIMSYGALALSWVLANTILIKKKFGTIEKKEENYYSDLIYTCLKYGTILLAAGLILGGVWADYSWGRFWGWDPKETWSLIVLCIYMAILHGRYTSWIPNHRFIPLTAAAFMSVMMAWFGVNYILAAGLHSYGFSEGGAMFLGTFFAAQTLLIIFTMSSFKKPQSLA